MLLEKQWNLKTISKFCMKIYNYQHKILSLVGNLLYSKIMFLNMCLKSDCMALEKQNYSSVLAFNENLDRIESLNKSSVTKKNPGIRMCNHWRMEENPKKDLFKSHQKLYKMITASYKDERPCNWLFILWKLFNFFNFSYCKNNFVFSSFVYFSSHI